MGKVISVELEDGEDVLPSLKKAFSENKVQRATMRSVEGRIKDFDLNVFGGGLFRKKHFDEEFKVTSIHGIFLEKGNMGYRGELNVALAGEDSNSAGGTLINAKASGRLIISADVNEFK